MKLEGDYYTQTLRREPGRARREEAKEVCKLLRGY